MQSYCHFRRGYNQYPGLDMDIAGFLLKRHFRIGDFRVILWKPDKEHLIAEEIDRERVRRQY